MTNEERRQFYQNALEDHRQLLGTAIGGMQNGDLLQALPVATGIRVLIHETGRTKPLLKNLKSNYLELPIRCEKPAEPEKPGTIVFYCPINAKLSSAEPHIRLGDNFDLSCSLNLNKWWSGICLSLPGIGPMTRKEIVLNMADKQAAHADHAMDASYKKLLKSQFINFKIGSSNMEFANISKLCVGAMGWQMLKCLELIKA